MSHKRCSQCGSAQTTIAHPYEHKTHYCNQECLNLSWLKSNPNVITMTIQRIKDGDTIVAIDDTTLEKHDIRLLQIDAPEKAQQYGLESKNYLSRLAPPGTSIYVFLRGKDKYKRDLGRLFTKQGLDINYEMIKTGNAWYYGDFDHPKNQLLLSYQKNAQLKQLGLWSEKSPIPPKLFRKQQRKPRVI